MDTHTWVRHRDHGGYWQCPTTILDEMRAQGWEPSEAPEEPNPAVAEQLAWRREQELAAQSVPAEPPDEALNALDSESTKAAPRAKSE